MKKLTLIFPIVLLIVLAFTFNEIPETKSNPSPQGTVTFHIKGCVDCSSVGYCLDGAGFVSVGNCVFSINCDDGKTHKICIRGMNCTSSFYMGVSRTFSCDASVQQDIYLDCSENCNCECPNQDKKK